MLESKACIEEIAALNQIELAIFVSRSVAICEEMGVVLRQAAFSPNIKDRLDFSCALFDADGRLFAQAAHVPVHLGSMAFAMSYIVGEKVWHEGDMLIFNDPYLGGTHLPDVTLVQPFFIEGELLGFVANRAHHANIGADSPGSMPISSSLEEEGLLIAPTFLYQKGKADEALFAYLNAELGVNTSGDLAAQCSANILGVQRIESLAGNSGRKLFQQAVDKTNQYGLDIAMKSLKVIPVGCYQFEDKLDDDGWADQDLQIVVTIQVSEDQLTVDFTGTRGQVKGNVNCPLSVTAAAVFYCFRCLLPEYTPACSGVFKPIKLLAPEACLVNAQRPAATAAGNVETSQRIVDCVFGALAKALPELIPAASQGTMNNVAMGIHQDDISWDYYETLGGGMGGGPQESGISAVQSHMTNTLNTPIESLEMHYPIRIRRYQIRRGSGGKGRYSGGDGLIREYEFLGPAEATLITERRRHPPWGLCGGLPGQVGRNMLDGELLPGKCQLTVQAGQTLRIETPGGGAWGED